MDKKHKKKMIASIIIISILVIYIVVWALCWSIIPVPVFIKIAGLVIAGISIAMSAYVLSEHIEEIKKGEEDDISNY
jgi:archaellum biogenesis protein FlaJ (TadC family)